MNTTKINALIAKKVERQAILNERKNQLEKLRKELFSSTVGRFFGKMGFYIKRYVSLVLGIVAIVSALVIFAYPALVFNDADKDDLLMKYKADYYELAGKTIDDSVRNYETTGVPNSPTATTDLVRNINNSIVKTMETELLVQYQYLAVGLLVIGLLLLYISVMSKSIHFRNLKIVQAENLAKAVIQDYELTIAEEAEELRLFRELSNAKISDIISPDNDAN